MIPTINDPEKEDFTNIVRKWNKKAKMALDHSPDYMRLL